MGASREYQALATIDARQEQTYGIACLQPDGSWQIQG
jgi:surface antigen